LNILGGWTIQEYFYESLNVNASGFTNDVSTYNAIQTGDPSLLSASSGETRWSLLSALYRLNYNYKGKYLLTVSGRHDGSSRLAKGNQWEFFPSAAIAWKLSEEKFVKEIGFISNLKLRISYGKTGSQSIAPYATHARLSSGYTYLGNQQVVTFSPAISANSSLKWEVTNQTDIGANLGLFNNRLNLEVDYYHKKTNDLLLERELSGQTGFSSRLENVGSLQNNGIEFNIDGIIISNNNFSWHSNLTYALNKNEVLELSGDKEYLMNGTGSRIIIGEPIGTFTGAKFIGLWQDTDENIGTHIPGSPKFEDIDGNGIINENDVQILGKGTPDFYGGWNNIFKYKHLTVSCFFDFSYGNDIYDLNGREFNTGHASNVYGKYRDRWTTSNTNSNIPRAGSMQQDYWENVAKIGTNLDIYDGSYFRLKTLNIQYEIPTNKKIFKNIVFYTSATNLFTLTKYEGFSPDVNSEGTNSTRRGFDNYNLPQARVFLLGIKTNF
jgi:TonB-linked SusC/RagA family outer membrane protein